MSRPSSPRSPGGSGVRATDVGLHACFSLAGKEVTALIIKDTTHLDGLYTVQLEQAIHGRDDAIQIPESVTSGLRNMDYEQRAKHWLARAKYFGNYVTPGATVLNPVGREAMRQALRSLDGGRDILKRWSRIDDAWEAVLDPMEGDEESALRAAEVFDAVLAEGGKDYLYPPFDEIVGNVVELACGGGRA